MLLNIYKPWPNIYCPQAPVMPEAEFERALTAAEATYHTFRDIPREAFPLFLSSKTWWVVPGRVAVFRQSRYCV